MAEHTQDDAGGLAGGLDPRPAAPYTAVGGPPGGTNALAGSGGSMRTPTADTPDQRGTNNLAKQDAEAAFEDGTRKPSGTEAKQWARDDADVETTAGTPYGGVAPDRQVHKMQRDKD